MADPLCIGPADSVGGISYINTLPNYFSKIYIVKYGQIIWQMYLDGVLCLKLAAAVQTQIIAAPVLPPNDAIQLVEDAIKFYCLETIEENVKWNSALEHGNCACLRPEFFKKTYVDVTDKKVGDSGRSDNQQL